jgi:integrase
VAEAVDRKKFYSPKTHRSRRPILLADEDMKRLTEFRRRTGRAGEDDWLFLRRFGTGPIHAAKALETLQSAAKRVGISYVSWHILRYWHTTVLHDEGVPLEAVQDRLGHADAHTIMKHYVHLSRRAERQEADAVSRHFRDSGTGKTWSECGSKFGSKSDVGDTVVAVSH